MAINPNLFAGLGPFAGLTQAATESLSKGVGQLFGLKDPVLERNRVLSQLDYNDPASLQTAAQELARMGQVDDAMKLASQARTISTEERKYKLDMAKYQKDLIKEATDEERKRSEFYSKNPEQATFRLEELARTLATNPSDPVTLKEYEQITAAASAGAMERFEKEQKSAREATAAKIDEEKSRVLIKKYNKELEEATKFGPGQRWDAETDAARTLLNSYGIDPNKPIKDQVPARLLYGPGGQSLIRAQETALQRKTTEGGGPSPSTGNSDNLESMVKAAGQSYEPEKYDYRVGPNGEIQRRKKN
jgi:hypothetical protein